MEFSNDFLKYTYRQESPNYQSYSQDFERMVLDQQHKRELELQKDELKQEEQPDSGVMFGPGASWLGVAVGTSFVDMFKNQGSNSKSVASQFVDINARDAQQIAIQSRLQQFNDTEGTWLPQITAARQYLTAKRNLANLDLTNDNNMDQANYYLEQIRQLEPSIREYAQKNPYLQDIFYGSATDPNKPYNTYGYKDLSKSRILDLMNDGNLSYYWENLSWEQNNSELTPKNGTIDKKKLDDKLNSLNLAYIDAKEEYDRKDAEIKERQQALKTKHMLHDPLLGVIPLGVEYDPDNIDPELDELRSKVEIEITDPSTWKYGLLHIGSSLGEIQTMSTQALIGAAAKRLGKTAIGSSGLGTAVLIAGEQALSLASARYMRHKETAAEVLNHYSEKILNYANEGRFDLNKVLSEYSESLQNMGFDTSKMEPLEVLQFGLSYNIPTSDKNYNFIAKDSRKGLTQLEEMNNALAIGDYAQYMGLSYGGKLLNQAIGPKAILKGANNLVRKSKTMNRLLTATSNQIDNAFTKIVSNPITRKQISRVSDYGISMAAQMGKQWILEGTEEGQQNLGSVDYKAIELGADVNDEYNIFRGFANAARLGVEANLALHGLSSNDLYNTNETLAMEMSVGGFIGALLGSAGNISQVGRLRSQLKADQYLKSISAKGYDTADQTLKTDMFLDYLSSGKNAQSFIQTLEDSKKFKHSGVTDQMIDEDIELFKTVQALNNNELTKQNLMDMGILKERKIKDAVNKVKSIITGDESSRTKGDIKDYDSYTKFMQVAVNINDRLKNSLEFAAESQRKTDEELNKLFDSKTDIFDNIVSSIYESSSQELKDKTPYEQFRRQVITSVANYAYLKALRSLQKDLTSRKNSINQLSDKYNISLNSNRVQTLLTHVNDAIKNAEKEVSRVDKEFFNNTLGKAYNLLDTNEYEKAVAINTLNQAIVESLNVKRNAYVTGRLRTKDRALVEVKPLWSTLDDKSKEEVRQKYGTQWMEEHKTDKQPTEKQLMSYYNMKINQDWSRLEEQANVEEVERNLATHMFRQDIQEARRLQEVAKQEMQQETGIQEEQVRETQDANVDLQTKTEPKPNINTDNSAKGNDNADTSEQTNVTKKPQVQADDVSDNTGDIDTVLEQGVDQVISDQLGDQAQEVRQEEYEDLDNFKSSNLDEEGVDQALNQTEDNKNIDQDIEDSKATEELLEQEQRLQNNLQEVYDDSTQNQPISISEVQDAETENVSEEPAIGNEQETPEVEVSSEESPKVEVPNPVRKTMSKVTVESFDGSEQDSMNIELTPEDQITTVVVDDDGSITVNDMPVSQEILDTLEQFDNADFIDDGPDYYARKQSDKSPGLDNKQKVEKNWISRTFFYQPNSTDIMPISTVQGGVTFGKDAVRHSGMELSQKLSQPGWFDKCKKYYIVTDSKQTRKNEKDAADRMAVHLIIEETIDGVKHIYNTALYQPDKAELKLNRLTKDKQHISNEIKRLRSLRAAIINQYIQLYCPDYFSDSQANLPTEAKDGVVPMKSVVSNGTIISEKDENNQPIYKNLTEIPGLEIPSDPYEMGEALTNGDIEIGYGLGAFPVDRSKAFMIIGMDKITPLSTQGTGYAGKIYIVPKLKNTPSQRNSVPLMLSESTHRIPGGTVNMQLSTTTDGRSILDSKGRPTRVSTAEAIFNLLAGTYSIDGEFNGEYENPIDISDTDLPAKSRRTIGQYLLDVLCNHGPRTLVMGESERGNLSFMIRKVLHAYDQIQDENGNVVRNESGIIYGSKKDNGDYVTKRVKLGGINEEQKKDVIRHIARNIHWNTDVEDMMSPINAGLRAHAIWYMNKYGVDKVTYLNVDELTFTMEDLGLQRDKDGKVVPIKDEAPLLITWMIRHNILKTDLSPQIFGAPFVYANAPQVQTTTDVEQVEAKPEKKEVKENKTIVKEQPKEEKPAEQKSRRTRQKLNIVRAGQDVTEEEIRAAGFNPKPQNDMTYVVYDNGQVGFVSKDSKIYRTFIGVPSQERGEGQIDYEKSKKWLNETLGIPKDNILSTRSAIKLANLPGDAYGVMEVAFDRISQEFVPMITLSKKSGKGIEYHEGYHYVSLLVLTEEQRNAVYSSFIQRNKQYKDYTKQQLEEVLAEEFRSYMLKLDTKHIGYKVLNLFKTIKDLIDVWVRHRPNYYGNLFRAIRSGKFKQHTVSQEALQEFAKAYQNGIHYYVPGLSEESKSSIPNINSSKSFYDIVESLGSTALAMLNIQTIDDIKNINIKNVFDSIENMYNAGEYDDSPYISMIEDVIDNKEVFINHIHMLLQQLGVRVIEEDDKEQTDVYDNIWDRLSYEVSKKDNIAFRAKLFFYSIPQAKYVADSNGNNQLEYVKDPIFNLPKSQPFNITWNKILENLWNVETWDDAIEEIKRLSQSDPFFGVLLNKVSNPDSPLPENTITQLITTIKSSKNSMDTVSIDSTAASDINSAAQARIWTVQDSDNLRKIARLPSNWSQNFLNSSLITTNSKGDSLIDKDQYKLINDKYKQIQQKLAILPKSKQIPEDLQKIKNNVIKLMNKFGVPIDMQTLNYLIDELSYGVTENIHGLKALNSIINGINMPQSLATWVSNLRALFVGRTLQAKIGGRKFNADRFFNTDNRDALVNKIAIAYGTMHPTPEEFSVTGADGNLVYPISENNFMSDQVRWLNSNKYDKLTNIGRNPYSRNSIIYDAIANRNKKLKLHTLIAINESTSNTSRDYFGISPLEDYITKMVLTSRGRIILPTMSDKKTWYSIEGVSIPMYSNVIEGGQQRSLQILYNYFLDEYNAIVNYFNKKADVESGIENYYKNYHGKIGNDGKMKPGGNGGRFRYFNRMLINGQWVSLNQLLDTAERSEDPNQIKEVLDNLKALYVDDPISTKQYLKDTFEYMVDKQIKEAIKLGLIGIDPKTGMYVNKHIPQNILAEVINKSGKKTATDSESQHQAIIGAIQNYTLSYMISIEELEKCFVGDPAFYKWGVDSEVGIFQRDVDKIKRLSSVLSTGTNLRTNWGKDDPRNNPNFTSAIMSDNLVKSRYYDKLLEAFKSAFIRTMLSRQNPKLTDAQLFEMTSTPEKIQESYNSLTEENKKFVDTQSTKAADPYGVDEDGNGNINQADAAVYIRPEFYKRIMQALGRWSDEIQAAYDLLESDPKGILEDPEKYAKALQATIQPLKMTYFGEAFDNVSGMNVPSYYKMAMFPMFKFFAGADNSYIYDRMNNEELGTIDMLLFESAVKVGATAQKFKAYNDVENNSFNVEDLNQPSSYAINGDNVVKRTGKTLNTRVQNINQLRMQLNTDSHEPIERSFGTQAIKICIGNVVDSRTYGSDKGKKVSGKQIKEDVFGCIKALSSIGQKNIRSKFFNKRGGINNKALSKYLMQQAANSGMSSEIIEALNLNENGEFNAPIASLSIRSWIESKIISLINSEVIDVNTPGGSAIQMAPFGFKNKNVLKQDEVIAFNDGKPLSFDPDEGSMQVMLSTNFFRHVVPEEYQKSYTSMRNWLLEHNIIGENAQPFGIGYRIPTQGLSSTISFRVADVLPSFMGDVIVVPDEFTAMTGSDYDVDKLYIATYAYDPETNEKYQWNEEAEYYNQQSKGALINRLLDSYMLVISDKKTISETRASIDTLTSVLKKTIVKKVKQTEIKEADPFYELMPAFQIGRKTEYTSGKAGISPFALNSTNHCLTQATHLTMNYSNNNIYGLGRLDAIIGQDGFKILDWLSAMINAHVDVAKDPYIISLNVNSATYNMTNLLLRGGKGELTFYFLAQPILRSYSDAKLNNSGIVGSESMYENVLIGKIKAQYIDMLESMPDYQKMTDEQKDDFIRISDDERRNITFNKDLLIRSLDNFKDNTPTMQDIKLQLIVLDAYSKLQGDAQILSDLVQRSQIDTKKYGNTVAQLQNFYNSYRTFITDNDMSFDQKALQRYFEDTFLVKKLNYALDLSQKLLQTQIIPATYSYNSISSNILYALRGGNYERIKLGNYYMQLYKSTADKKFIKSINDKIESILRAKQVISQVPDLNVTDEELNEMIFGKDNIARRLNKLKEAILQHKDDPRLEGIVDSDGNIVNDFLNYLQGITSKSSSGAANKIVTTQSSLNNDRYTEDRLRSSFYDLINSDIPTIRDTAKLLIKYAFVSSYDNRTPNSFFQLVPQETKNQIGYTDAIKQLLQKLNNGNLSINMNDPTMKDLINSIYLSLVRNYSEDNSIVPTFIPQGRIDYSSTTPQTVFNYTPLKYAKNVRYQDTMASIMIRGDRKDNFIKMYNQTGYNLYRKVGEIQNTDGKTINTVYVITPKLGTTDVKELFKEGFEQSAFDNNKLSNDIMKAITTDFGSIRDYALKLSGKDAEFIFTDTYGELFNYSPDNMLSNNFEDYSETIESNEDNQQMLNISQSELDNAYDTITSGLFDDGYTDTIESVDVENMLETGLVESEEQSLGSIFVNEAISLSDVDIIEDMGLSDSMSEAIGDNSDIQDNVIEQADFDDTAIKKCKNK